MDLRESKQHERFRGEVKAFLDAEWTDADRAAVPPRPRHTSLIGHALRRDEAALRFRGKAIERGYLYRHVPRRYGGSEQVDDPLRERIIAEEFRAAQAPLELVGQGASMLVPTLLEHGSEVQKERFIRDTLLGHILWCQGYSEPGSGSDLASLRTSARLEGDVFVVDGHKIWTSNADQADWAFCLVRTEETAPRHRGISYLLVDLRTPGIDIRPFRTLTGEVHFNEVFFDEVRVPAENLVGARGQGWEVSRATLKYERGMMGGTSLPRRSFDDLVSFAQSLVVRGRRVIDDPVLRDRLIAIEARLRAQELHSDRLLTLRERGEQPGITGLVAKLYSSQLGHDLARLSMDLLSDHAMLAPGEAGAPDVGRFAYAYLWSVGVLIAGGTSNVQRNVIGERGLGLPRDPRP